MATAILQSPPSSTDEVMEAVIISGARRGEIVRLPNDQTLAPIPSMEEEAMLKQFFELIASIETTVTEIAGSLGHLNNKMDDINGRLREPI